MAGGGEWAGREGKGRISGVTIKVHYGTSRECVRVTQPPSRGRNNNNYVPGAELQPALQCLLMSLVTVTPVNPNAEAAGVTRVASALHCQNSLPDTSLRTRYSPAQNTLSGDEQHRQTTIPSTNAAEPP